MIDSGEPGVDDLARLLREAYHVPPDPDLGRLWPAVRERSRRRVPVWHTPAARWLIAAGVVLAAGIGVVAGTVHRQGALLPVEQAFAPAIARLAREVEFLRDQLPAETMARLDDVRAESARAVAETRQAVQASPDRADELIDAVEGLLRSEQETLEFMLSVSRAADARDTGRS